MKNLSLLTESETEQLSAGDAQPTGVTGSTSLAHDLSYFAGLVFGTIAGVWMAYTSADAISVVEWKTGIREAK
jgi:hypothetical protein